MLPFLPAQTPVLQGPLRPTHDGKTKRFIPDTTRGLQNSLLIFALHLFWLFGAQMYWLWYILRITLWSIHFYAIQSSGDTFPTCRIIIFSSWKIHRKLVQNHLVADIVPVYFMLLGSRSQGGNDEFNVGFQESVLFGLEILLKGWGSLCCLASQCKIFLFLSSPAVSIGPVGSRAAVCHCCWITWMWWTVPLVARVTWSALSPVRGALPFRPAMGSTSGPCRWVGNLGSSGPSPWGGTVCMLLLLAGWGKGLCF